ncbi:MAG TPA: hypothetical protein PKM25_09470, partial [Candidatus Ozemobacteraceae bacterium]|nr:hypothetical protein [Candidatus Ozemobacteraceae bacterium]
MKKMLLVLAFIVFSVQNLNAELISRVLGDCPNFSQTSNGNFLAVVSRDYGRGAKAGALVEFFYPLYARDHLWDAYNGIYMNGRLSWLHDLRLVGQSMPDDTGIVTSEFCTADGKLSIVTSDVALRDSDTLVRHLEITNNSKERVDDLRVFFYEHFTVNYLGTGDVVRFDQKSRTILHGGKDVHFTIGSDIPADQWQIGKVGSTWITNHDARLDAEDGRLRGHMHERGMLDMGVNGALGHTFRGLKPGERLAINYFISAGRSLDESWKSFHLAKSRLWNEILTSEAGFWNGWLGKAKELVGADERTRRVYRRALITLKQNTADN